MVQLERHRVINGFAVWRQKFFGTLRHHPQAGWEFNALPALVPQFRIFQIAVRLGLALCAEIFPHPFAHHLSAHYEFEMRVLVAFNAELVLHENIVAIRS